VGKVYLNSLPMAWEEATLIAPLYLLFGFHGGLYRSELLLQPRKAAFKCLYTVVASAVVLVVLSFYAKMTTEFSRVVLTFGCALSFGLLMTSRTAISAWLRRTMGPTLRNTLIIHAGGPDIDVAHAFNI